MNEIQFNQEKHEYRNAAGVLFPSVTQILLAGGLSSGLEFVDEQTRDDALDRGIKVHWMCQLIDEGLCNRRTFPQWIRGYGRAFLAWKAASQFTPIAVEEQFIDERLGYAGTLDRWGRIGNRQALAVVDLKTGAGIPESTKYQLSAYACHKVTRQGRCRRIAVLLNADGTYKVKEWGVESWATDLAKFLEALKGCHERSQ